MNGFVFLDKQAGSTSTYEGGKLKSVFKNKKVGHD